MPYYDDYHIDKRNNYYEQLVAALEAKAENLERTTIRQLRDHLQGIETGVSAIYKFLIDKGLMQADPYKHERSITEVQVPSSESLTDSDVMHDISQRFSHYVSQWEFLVNIFHVSLSNLSLKEVRRLLDLIDYIRWTDFSVSSSFQITRAVAGVMGRVSQMNDPMAGKIMSSSASHLGDLSNKIKSELKIVTVFLKEHYKMRVRKELIHNMKIDPEQYRRKPVSIIDNVNFEFSHRMKDSGWYKELIYDLLEEDYGIAAEKLRVSALERLKVSQSTSSKKKKAGPDDKTVLLGVLDRIARAGDPIRSCIVKMNDNSKTLQERKKSLGEKLSELISSIFKKSDGGIVYEIAMKDTVTGSVSIEVLNYTRFSALTLKRARSLQDLQDTNSVIRKNAASVDASKLHDYLNKNLSELKAIHRRLTGLDGYFQSKAIPSEIKSRMRASSLTLKTLKLIIADSMKMLNEFRVKKEEKEQLKKLGVED
jgi:hypothetical protein